MVFGMRLSPYTKEAEFVIVGKKLDETNEFRFEFATSKLEKRRTVTVIPDDGKGIQVMTDRLTRHTEYWCSSFEFQVDGDLCGEATFRIEWDDYEIVIEVSKDD